MKRNPMYLMMTLAITTAIMFSACQKTNSDNKSQLGVQSDDQSRITGEIDATANDVNTAIEANLSFNFKSTTSSICDASWVVDSNATTKSITITYNGGSCLGDRTRSGVIVASMPVSTKWSDAGAAITVSYQNLKITRNADKQSITFNGTVTITNVSGGKVVNLANTGSITHTINSDGVTVTFNDGTQGTWHVAKQRVFSYDNGIVITGTGTHTEGNVTNIAEWGKNRLGVDFTTVITDPLVIRQDCSFRLTSGKLTHTTMNLPVTMTFGLDASGAATSCPGAGHYYLKVEWKAITGVSSSIMLPY